SYGFHLLQQNWRLTTSWFRMHWASLIKKDNPMDCFRSLFCRDKQIISDWKTAAAYRMTNKAVREQVFCRVEHLLQRQGATGNETAAVDSPTHDIIVCTSLDDVTTIDLY